MKLKSMLAATAMAASFLMAAHSANASTLLFTLNTADIGPITFALDSDPTPTFATSTQSIFADVPMFANGSEWTYDLTFQTPDSFNFTDFSIGDGGATFFAALGPQLFTGTTDAPHFAPGTFDVETFDLGPCGNSGCAGSLTISNAGVPEPAEWALLIAGAGLAGATLRMQRRKAAATAAA